MANILIKNGTVIDGVGKAAKKADVLLSANILDIGPNIKAKAATVIDATDKFVTPGFLDIQNHSDSYLTLLEQPQQTSLIAQGITSIVVGNCGSSLAPLANREALKTIQKWHNLSGININWATFAEFMSQIKLSNVAVNVESLTGHATLRRGLVMDAIRKASEQEVKIMKKMLERSIAEGSKGLSLGLVYAHEVDSSIEELLSLVQSLKPKDKLLSVHLRSENVNILESVDEAIFLASKTGVRLKISHLKIRGKENWHLFDRVINKLENAYHQGIDVSFDVYPYTSAWSVLYTYLPKWAYEGGRNQILKHLQSQTDRRKILDYLKGQHIDFNGMIVASSSQAKAFMGKSVAQIAANLQVCGEQALLNVLEATSAEVVIFDHNLSEEHVELLCSSPLSVIATDGAGYSGDFKDLVHPRCFGTMPKFLRMVREKKILTWEQAIKKITSEPARIAGIKNRGQLSLGMASDVVIFDPKTIADKATYEYPNQPPIGISAVIVKGKVAS